MWQTKANRIAALVGVVAMGIGVSVSIAAAAQNLEKPGGYPKRTVTILITVGTGGGTGQLARSWGAAMENVTGVGFQVVSMEDDRLELVVTEREEEEGRSIRRSLGLEDGEAYFVASPGSSFGSSKCWTVDGFGDTVRGLFEQHGLRSLVQGGPGEEELAQEICRAAGPAAIDGTRVDISLPMLKPLLRDAQLLAVLDRPNEAFGVGACCPNTWPNDGCSGVVSGEVANVPLFRRSVPASRYQGVGQSVPSPGP